MICSSSAGGRWVFGHIDVQNATPAKCQGNQHVEHAKGRGRRGQKIDRDQVLKKDIEERKPCLVRRLPVFGRQPGDCPFRDLDPEFEQLVVNARRSPERIGLCHLFGQSFPLSIDQGAPGLFPPRQSGPEELEVLSMPADEGLRLNDHQGRTPWLQILESHTQKK
jgi:hypothetical protein